MKDYTESWEYSGGSSRLVRRWGDFYTLGAVLLYGAPGKYIVSSASSPPKQYKNLGNAMRAARVLFVKNQLTHGAMK